MVKQKHTLLILAAGMGSRFGGNKQIEGFGPHAEMIMDYSIYDALRAGFHKVVFVIREDFYEAFHTKISARWGEKIDIRYVFQSITSYVGAIPYSLERSKPWGTAHAILCAKEVIQEPFLMINADDFYGTKSFEIAHQFLTSRCETLSYGLIAYRLSQTVSRYGSVSRGVCQVRSGYLEQIREHKKIYYKNGDIVSENEQKALSVLAPDTPVSMNFFCFHPSIFTQLEKAFHHFLEKEGTHTGSEFLISNFLDDCIRHLGIRVCVEDTDERWFGVTYKEDADHVRNEIKQKIHLGIYPQAL